MTQQIVSNSNHPLRISSVKDEFGNTLSGANGESASIFNVAVQKFNCYRDDPIALLDEALALSPDFAMAMIFKGYLFALATEPGATQDAVKLFDSLNHCVLNQREKSHAAALQSLLQGNWSQAAIALDHHNIDYPLDMIALQVGHLIDFFRANSRNLRDRIPRVLPKWSSDLPGYSYLLGMHAFGLEECGHYSLAEKTGIRAIELEPLDCWAHHAVSHVYEMSGRSEDGIAWMRSRETYWSGDNNFFKIHNWWHYALFHMDNKQHREALWLYDTQVRAEQSTVALDLVDASALLWRLALVGHDVGDRWQALAKQWDEHANGTLYSFNDWHAVMAYLGAGDQSKVAKLQATHQSVGTSETSLWAKQIGSPLIEGFRAFWHGEYTTAINHLYGARHIANQFGGSHAQRDIVDWTLMEAAQRGGNQSLAEALANERLSVKPHSPLTQWYLNRARHASRDIATQHA